MRLTVGIAVHGAAQAAQKCISSVTACCKMNGYDYQIIVVNDHSDANTCNMLLARQQLDRNLKIINTAEHIPNPPPNLAWNVNYCLDQVRPDDDYYLSLESDCFVNVRTIHEMIQGLERHPECSAVLPLFRARNENDIDWMNQVWYSRLPVTGDDHVIKELHAVKSDIPVGCVLLPGSIARDKRLRIDERFGLWGADDDYWHSFLDITKKSILCCNQAEVVHLHSASSKPYELMLESAIGLLREKYSKNFRPSVTAAVLLCDRKRNMQMTAIPALAAIPAISRLYVNIESSVSGEEFDREYGPILTFLKKCKKPHDIDVWNTCSTWQKKPQYSMDQRRLIPIVQARNMAISYAVCDEHCTHLLFVDDDVQIDAAGVDALLSLGKDLCGGLVKDRMMGSNVQYAFNVYGEDSRHITCEYGTCGYMLIRRALFQRLRFRFAIGVNLIESEDPAYCRDAARLGAGPFIISKQAIGIHVDDKEHPITRDQYARDDRPSDLYLVGKTSG